MFIAPRGNPPHSSVRSEMFLAMLELTVPNIALLTELAESLDRGYL